METFTDEQIIDSIRKFLEFGEQTKGTAHQGYFSGDGFAARCLRYHYDNFPKKKFKCFCCSREFTDTDKLDSHEQNDHPNEYYASMVREMYGGE